MKQVQLRLHGYVHHRARVDRNHSLYTIVDHEHLIGGVLAFEILVDRNGLISDKMTMLLDTLLEIKSGLD